SLMNSSRKPLTSVVARSMTGLVNSASCDSDRYRLAKSVTGLSAEVRIVTVADSGRTYDRRNPAARRDGLESSTARATRCRLGMGCFTTKTEQAAAETT